MSLKQIDRAPVYSEAGRSLRKRIDLRRKFNKRQSGSAKETKKTISESENTSLLNNAITNIEKKLEEERKRKGEVNGPHVESVQLAAPSTLILEGKCSEGDQRRLQALVGTGKSDKLKIFSSKKEIKKTIRQEDLDSNNTVVFSDCCNCEFILDTYCVKVFVERCKNFVLRINDKVITSTVELNRCEQVNCIIATKIGCLRVEQSRKVNIVYNKEEYFGYAVWAGSFMLRLQVADKLARCDFGLVQKLDKTVNIERTQFKVWMLHNKLVTDKVKRLVNGFPTTVREEGNYDRKQKGNINELADRMGITVHPADYRRKIKPNARCPCNSGKKYKKCCKP